MTQFLVAHKGKDEMVSSSYRASTQNWGQVGTTTCGDLDADFITKKSPVSSKGKPGALPSLEGGRNR